MSIGIHSAGLETRGIGSRRSEHDACVICATPRSGSWLLAEGLLETGVAGRPEEYFRPDWYGRFVANGTLEYQHRLVQFDRWPDPPAKRGRQLAITADLAAFMEAVKGVAATPNGVVALKVHWHQFEDLLDILRMDQGPTPVGANPLAEWFPGALYVFLRRRNKVRQAISYLRAIRSGVWCLNRDGDTPAGDPHNVIVDADVEEIERLRLRLLKQEQCWEEFFAKARIEPLEIVYEDLASDPQRVVASVLTALGRATHGSVAPPRLRRQGDALTEELETAYYVRRRSGTLRSSTRAKSRGMKGRTRTEVIVANDFYADPEAIREYALTLDYYFPYQSDTAVAAGEQQATWMTSRFTSAERCPFKSSPELIARLEELTGEAIDVDHWRAGFPTDAEGKPAPEHKLLPERTCVWNCSFHCKLQSDQRLGDGVHNHVTDSWNGVGRDGWAGILYLDNGGETPLEGGLKLWRNRDPDAQFEWMTERENWELVDNLGNVPNRLLLCRGDIPHSGAAGWGTGLLSGRLFQTFFFKTVTPVLRPGVSIAP